MLWVKTFHIVFIASWFAGLFYLPRIFVNLAQQSDSAVQVTLLGMARRLYRFTTILEMCIRDRPPTVVVASRVTLRAASRRSLSRPICQMTAWTQA